MKMSKVDRDCITALRSLEHSLYKMSDEVGAMRDRIEIPFIIAEIKSRKRSKKNLKVSPAWLQRKYDMGYSRAARLMDILRAEKVVK